MSFREDLPVYVTAQELDYGEKVSIMVRQPTSEGSGVSINTGTTLQAKKHSAGSSPGLPASPRAVATALRKLADSIWMPPTEDEQRATKCSSCRAAIIWLTTEKGANMPVDSATVEPHDKKFDAKKHTSHFATCPHAPAHRRKR